jgi:hypothetical protein
MKFNVDFDFISFFVTYFMTSFDIAFGVGLTFGPGTVQGSPLLGAGFGSSRFGTGLTFGFDGMTIGSVMLGCVFIVIRF